MKDTLREKAAGLPQEPGVYLFKDAEGTIIYIGKAKSLKKRVASYFRADLSGKTMILMSQVRDIEYRLCPTESLALLLEAGLIRRHRPKYNISLRDDKSFPFVKITNEEFPAVCVTRKREDDGALYLGPYTSARLLREALTIIRRAFPFRSCRTLPQKACMYYRIGLSPAPCIGKIGRKEYRKTIDSIVLILQGKTEGLVKKLSLAMQAEAGARRYEAAAALRDRITALNALSRTSAVSSAEDQLQDLRDLLHLDTIPRRIEAFDISDISGKEACGSMVSFYNGSPDKDNYRRFRIRTVEGIDDYRMLSEVVARRYRRLLEEKSPFPDLILIDGGRGHLLTADRELEQLGLRVPLVSIAKDRENIYTREKAHPLQILAARPALNLIRRIRDEAHRFALSYHHVLRRKVTLGR